MATAPQPPQQQGRRLSVRGLQQRRRRAEVAYAEAELKMERWRRDMNREVLEKMYWVGQQSVEEDDRAMARLVDDMRAGDLDAYKLGRVLYYWGAWRHHYGQCNRAISLLLEAIAVLKPPRDRFHARALVVTSAFVGEFLCSIGRLEEAEAVLLEALPLKINPSEEPVRLHVRVVLADVYLEMGRVAEALELAQMALPHLAALNQQKNLDTIQFDQLCMIVADVCMAAGQPYHGTAFKLLDTARISMVTRSVFSTMRMRVSSNVIGARKCILYEPQSLPRVEVDLNMLLWEYNTTVERGLLTNGNGGRLFIRVLEVTAEVKRLLGKHKEAARVESELAELEALMRALSQAALDELQAEMQAERAAGAGGDGAGAAAAPAKKKKPSRKQQKRRAAQRRKAEARATAAEADEETTAVGGTQEEHKGEPAADSEQHVVPSPPPPLEDATPDEPEPEPEEPVEECAICLGDLPAAGAGTDGAVLLACSHTFHADCLGRWKDKCLEKGLRFTCAMCRGAVVVVAGAGEKSG